MKAIDNSRMAQTRVESLDKPIPQGYTRLRYIGGRAGAVVYYANGHPYAAGNTPPHNYIDAPIEDADLLKRLSVFAEVIIKPLVPAVTVAPVEPVTQNQIGELGKQLLESKTETDKSAITKRMDEEYFNDAKDNIKQYRKGKRK
jgi:hypothetical protein